MRIAKKVEEMAPSGIRAFFDLVLGMQDVISLGVGEPDFVTPWHIREKAIYCLEKGYTSYTSNKGMPELRRTIANYLHKRHGISYDPEEEILITVGVSEAMDLAARATIEPGDRILVPEPWYVMYGPIIDLAGGKPVFLTTKLEHGFKITPRQLDEAVRKYKPTGLVLNYPSNPTGASYTKAELQELCQAIERHDLVVYSDEIYDELTYDFEHTPLPTFKGMRKRVIYLNGVSKSFAMTGFRLGWACGPAKVIGAMTKIHQYTMLCAPIVSQMATMEALKSGFKDVLDMKREYMRRRRFMVDALNAMGLVCHNPEGAFYVFPSIQSIRQPSLEFAKDLLKKKRVAVVPGVAFGESAEGFVRMSYASSFENLKEAIVRIKSYLGT